MADTTWDNVILAGFLLLPLVFGRLIYFCFRQWKLQQKRPITGLVLGNGLVFLLLCSLALLAGEIRYRFFFDTTQVTNATKTSKLWFTRHWRLNSWGIRDEEEYHERLTSGKRRVSFLGDSFTAGHGVEVHQRFANLYRARRPEQEVHVLAGCGMDTGDQLNLLLELLPRGYQFDQVVLCYYLNDTSDIIPQIKTIFSQQKSQPPSLFEHSYFLNTLYWRFALVNDPYAQDYFNVLTRSHEETYWRSRMVVSAVGQAGGLPQLWQAGWTAGTMDKPLWEIQKERLLVLRQMIESQGGQLAVVTWPFLNFGPEGYQARPVHKMLDAFWKSQGVPHLDLLPVLEAYPVRELIVNPYDAHPNARAHALAADAITAFLDQLTGRKGP